MWWWRGPAGTQRGVSFDIPMPKGAAVPVSGPIYIRPIYILTLVTGLVDHSTWWKGDATREPANVWWLEGGGLSRPATDVEIELWKLYLSCAKP